MVIFKNVVKYYENLKVLRDISFQINRGELVYITGPTGSGKTTLLKLIYLAEKPDQGEIIVGDFKVTNLKASQIPYLRRKIGVIFQDFKLIQNMTVFDNVAISLIIRKEKDIKNQVLEALKKVHLRHKADCYPKILSGGEQQRVVIARAIVSKPELILADEPTANLDPNTATAIMQLINEINLQGTTVIIATHYRELFRNTWRRIIRIDEGNLIEKAAQ
ncbi:MAG: cell division ATP-binding protein FtsE [Thermodesulfovibrionales bacterium]|nr:cell division ATP-binding protein FtsE [Thermodesulfovibrionales bacterium]